MQSGRMLLTTRLLWAGATGLGLAIPAILLGLALARLSLEGTWTLFALPFVMAASMGTAQWLVLRRHFRDTGYWILASMVGGGLGLLIGGAMTFFLMNGALIILAVAYGESSISAPETLTVWRLSLWMLPLILIGLIMGHIIGFSQWLALRRFVKPSGSWILFSGAGFALTPALLVIRPFLDMLSVMGLNSEIEPASLNLPLWVGAALGVLVLPGLVTGVGLLRFLSDHPRGSHAQDNGAS